MREDFEVKQKLISLTQSMIDRNELANDLGIGLKALSCLINRMRKQGHEIWSINTATGEWSIIYKGYDGAMKTKSLTDKIREQLKGQWISIDEVANNLDETRERIWGCLQGLYRSGEATRRNLLGMKPQYRIE
ncbi:hypothetical protein PP411_gp18 [Vibrio phage vB_VpP_BT-1011]|uniref:Uncharacterized protein n=1 Tax=Vibrio phage vB_VpP_BT-1011 TaxID=2799672 RepID=A0A8F2XX42_9CAUD|nr:hypothetical protein PP411_gp18 [Vibrio phage vB_VpP_BT-1011]QWX10217.1 hypothetical protein vBVpPBT1011_0018 [Vibrio phage vB_VpP_BT-1011]